MDTTPTIGMNSAAYPTPSAIAELREECERLRSECARLESKYERDVWGLNSEGDPIGGDPAGGFANDLFRVTAERDTLRQQLAERDATIERLEAGIQRDHWKQMAARKNMIVIVDVEPDTRRTTEYLVTEGHVRAMWKRMESLVEQRDKLAGLLREAHSAGRSRRLTVDELYRIAAALAEVNK